MARRPNLLKSPLFHELGHIYYGHNKKEVLIDSLHKSLAIEKEADEFASENLIPKAKYQEFKKRTVFSSDGIIAFANDIKIHPGIVVEIGRAS